MNWEVDCLSAQQEKNCFFSHKNQIHLKPRKHARNHGDRPYDEIAFQAYTPCIRHLEEGDSHDISNCPLNHTAAQGLLGCDCCKVNTYSEKGRKHMKECGKRHHCCEYSIDIIEAELVHLYDTYYDPLEYDIINPRKRLLLEHDFRRPRGREWNACECCCGDGMEHNADVLRAQGFEFY